MPNTTRRTWVRPSITPLTNPDSRSDAPDVAARNGTPSSPQD